MNCLPESTGPTCYPLRSLLPRFWLEWNVVQNIAFLGWATEHFDGDSQNLAGIFSHNSVERQAYLIQVEAHVLHPLDLHHVVVVAVVVPVVLAEQDERHGQEEEAVEEAEDHAEEEDLEDVCSKVTQYKKRLCHQAKKVKQRNVQK